MKKYYITLLVLLAISATACKNSFLDETPKGSITPVNFYKSSADLKMASAALANLFNSPFVNIASPFYGGDDITSKRNGNKIDFSDFDVFQPNSSNNRMTFWWNGFYPAIKSANALLMNYSNATEASDLERNNAAGHAYFTRAISYFYLTRVWGEVPVTTEPTIDNNRPNAKVADIYALIVSDLQKAETMLPDHWDGERQQKGIDVLPTRGSTKALLAQVYLTMAGWPLKQTDKYALAAAKAKEVIDNKATWGYDLLPAYADMWKIANKYNKETVFGCYYSRLLQYNTMSPFTYAAEDEGGWDDGLADISFFKRFPASPRKDATYQKDYFLQNNPAKVIGWEETVSKHPHFLKYRDDDAYNWTTHSSPDWKGGATLFIIRYADVLLTYAEAKAMSSAPDASAYDAINKVRARAAGVPNDLTPGLSQTDFRDAVIEERGWEFAAELGIRWFDLIRTETVAKANALRDPAEAALVNQPSDASHTYYWAPLPLNK